MFYSRRQYLEKGYTLLDALYHLIVFLLFSHLILLILVWIQKQNETYLTNENVTWEIFVNDFQQYLENVKEIEVVGYNDKIDISYVDTEETIQIGQLKEVIRKQVSYVGNVPMLIGIQNLRFELVENKLKMNVKFPNGIVKERVFIVQLHK